MTYLREVALDNQAAGKRIGYSPGRAGGDQASLQDLSGARI